MLSYQEALGYILSFNTVERSLPEGRASTDFYLKRMTALLEWAGSPHLRFPSVIVAGTKGKGSTCAMLEASLRAAGYRVGLWTSPHLHSYRERIQVNREPISDIDFAAIASQLPDLLNNFDTEQYGELPISYELLFWVAACYFAQQQVDIAILEVGVGGRYDSANLITPLVSVISSISYDHMAILGDTLGKIAYDKAGIIKTGVPVVSAQQAPEAAAVIAEVAHQQNAPLTIVDVSNTTIPRLSLRGPFQRKNAALALACLDQLALQGFLVNEAQRAHGLATTEWHGRLELVHEQPKIVLDAAHNGDSAQRLAEALQSEFRYTKLILVLGVLRDKAYEAISAGIVPHADTVIVTIPAVPRALEDLDALEASVRPWLTGDLHRAPTVAEALTLAQSLAQPDDLICVTGSFSTLSEAQRSLGISYLQDA
jgi:dihydrofolate synthase/folylpolyglutamate synthase